MITDGKPAEFAQCRINCHAREHGQDFDILEGEHKPRVEFGHPDEIGFGIFDPAADETSKAIFVIGQAVKERRIGLFEGFGCFDGRNTKGYGCRFVAQFFVSRLKVNANFELAKCKDRCEILSDEFFGLCFLMRNAQFVMRN